MAVTFRKSPLVELIAEVRWEPTLGGSSPAPWLNLVPQDVDRLAIPFGGEIYQEGFRSSERLSPPGVPVMQFAPLVRFRSQTDASVLFQLGHGTFSTNAVSPYHSWKRVRHRVELGLTALMKARAQVNEASAFSQVSLRYINAFGSDLTGGTSSYTFLRDVLKLSLSLPREMIDILAPQGSIIPNLQFTAPTIDGSQLAVTAADGLVGQTKAVILDMTATKIGRLEADVTSLMSIYDAFRNTMHKLFFGMTRTIHDLLEPEEVE